MASTQLCTAPYARATLQAASGMALDPVFFADVAEKSFEKGGVGGYKLEVSMPSKIAGSRLRVRGHRSQPSSQQLLVRASFRNSFGGFTREPGTLLKCHSQIVFCLVFPSYAHFVAFFGFLILCPNRDWHMLLWPAQSCRVRPSAQEDHAFDPRLLHKLPSELGD